MATEHQVRAIAALHTEKIHLALNRELDARVVARLLQQHAEVMGKLEHVSAQVETLRRIVVGQTG